MPSLVSSFPHVSHAPPDSLSYPSSLLPLLTPSWEGCHLGPTTLKGFCGFKPDPWGRGGQLLTSLPPQPESMGGMGASSYFFISRPSALQGLEKYLGMISMTTSAT